MASRYLTIFALILAGEAVFSLSFHVPRFFRPALLEVFQINNTQLGDSFAAYGVLAMLSYLLGGPLADRYTPRVMLSLSLMMTALGGLLMATIPGAVGLTLLYGYWGITTIFLFWAPLIRATREWGGSLAQGQAFGLLDGGRGLVAAGSATVIIVFLNWQFPGDLDGSTAAEKKAALQGVIYLYTGLTFAAGLLTWFVLPRSGATGSASAISSLERLAEVVRKPVVWAHAGVIVCAYCAYKGLDSYSLYAVDVLGMSQIEAATFTSNAAYLRFFAAIVIGLLADRVGAATSIVALFVVLIVSYAVLAGAHPGNAAYLILYGNLLVTFFCAYGMRGVYFALLEENRTPAHLTGTTAGLVSVLGYTPDIFFYSISGRILDSAPGLQGHLAYFQFLGGIMLLGLLMTAWVIRCNRLGSQAEQKDGKKFTHGP